VEGPRPHLVDLVPLPAQLGGYAGAVGQGRGTDDHACSAVSGVCYTVYAGPMACCCRAGSPPDQVVGMKAQPRRAAAWPGAAARQAGARASHHTRRRAMVGPGPGMVLGAGRVRGSYIQPVNGVMAGRQFTA
jgi:hypothetical protein